MASKGTSGPWDEHEIELILADYFAMLRLELLGQSYSKAEHRRALRPHLRNRSDGSVEYKHQNISAALIQLGQPYISGYKPGFNYQQSLFLAVERYVDSMSNLLDSPAIVQRVSPDDPVLDIPIMPAATLIEAAPDIITLPVASEPWKSRRGRRIDFVERDARNRRLGEAGEQFALEVERRRLLEAKRDDLADKIVWASRQWGDGLGFDILSHDETSGLERRIEVKTTAMPKQFPFIVTANEVACSSTEPELYHLYRVFDFTTSGRLFIVSGSLTEKCELQPMVYRAGIRGTSE